jgi:hypothetical protein
MQTIDEVPKEPYAEIVRLLLAASGAISESVGDTDSTGTTVIAELGIDPG